MNNYTAIIIGPMNKTFAQTRRSRELWGASYLFSYITKRLYEEIGQPENWCIPYGKEMIKNAKGKGAGFFPERLFFNGDIVNEVKIKEEEIIKEISEKSGIREDYLQNYLRIYAVNYSLPVNIEENNQEKNNNLVIAGNRLLDAIKQRERIYPDISDIDWQKGIDKINGNCFYREAFNETSEFKFPSLLEIATEDFRRKNGFEYKELVDKTLYRKATGGTSQDDQDRENQTNFINKLKDSIHFGSLKFRPYHKYVAVVEADGDNIGDTIATIGKDPGMVREFSSALFDFSMKATEKIKEYGAKPVYSGGEDLLFFAPIAVYKEDNNKTQSLETIFKLIKDIDDIFQEEIIENENLKRLYESTENPTKRPTMSYGISVSYYKFPLNEAKGFANKSLKKAKKIKDIKNKICFQVRKHSGQTFGTEINKGYPDSYLYFNNLLFSISTDKDLISSVIYKLKSMNSLLIYIAQRDEDNERRSISKKRSIRSFFQQEFDLKERNCENQKLSDKFIWNVVDYYYQLIIDFPERNIEPPQKETEEDNSNIGTLYSALRFVKHLTDENDE